jgi:hypothetical protein
MLPWSASKNRAFANFRSLGVHFGSTSAPTHVGPVDWLRTQVERHFGDEICCWSSQLLSLQSSSSFQSQSARLPDLCVSANAVCGEDFRIRTGLFIRCWMRLPQG